MSHDGILASTRHPHSLPRSEDGKCRVIAITGVAGFIGQHLVRRLSSREDIRIRALVHADRAAPLFLDKPNVATIPGDLMKPHTLERLIEPGCTVVNLAFMASHSGGDNLRAMDNLAMACAKAEIKRLVHCSTAVVVGGVPDDTITEETQCRPKSAYEIVKLRLETLLFEKSRDKFEFVVLRPTAVFGQGGRNLLKLAHDLTRRNKLFNYLKSCLYNGRRMNLVHIENVVSALAVLIEAGRNVDRQIFIISDDGSPINNYRDVEKRLMKLLGREDYLLPPIPLSPLVLAVALKMLGKSNTNPARTYDSRKLVKAGYVPAVPLEAGLVSFANWYKQQFLSA